MYSQFNYFWWDGGFESVHNKPDTKLNPNEVAHILTPYYRFDISRLFTTSFGMELNINKTENYIYGSTLQEPSIKFLSNIEVKINNTSYKVDTEINKNRTLMVYDSGSVCHQLRLKGISLIDEKNHTHPDIELEIVFFFWNDLISMTFLFLEKENRFPIKNDNIEIKIQIEFNGINLISENGGIIISDTNGSFLVNPLESDFSLENNTLNIYTDKNSQTIHILPLINKLSTKQYMIRNSEVMSIEVIDNSTGKSIPVIFDILSGGLKVTLPEGRFKETDWFHIRMNNKTGIDIPLRLILSWEGMPRLIEAGTLLNGSNSQSFSPMGVYPMAFNKSNIPTGSLWQVSTDGHEFENYPKAYTHKWMHLYSEYISKAASVLEEDLYIGHSTFKGQTAAQYCQLSLLGWDDNPHYGNEIDKTAVQLWHQGLIDHQEILCMCPESHMTDSVITDIRPIDQRNFWGPNNGGGDFLRYKVEGENSQRKMRAARCHFPNYGPNIGSVKYYMTSDDDCIIGEIDSHIVASNDIARIFFEAHYQVIKDCVVEDMNLIWLGCPGYDKSRYAKYAWGKNEDIMEDNLLEIQKGEGAVRLDNPLVGGEWFCAYRGGIIDEQFREPNGNKGLVYRGGDIYISSHPEASFKAKRIRTNVFDGLTTQFWIGISTVTDTINLKKGDYFNVSWEYVPLLKYSTDYALNENYSEVYKNILQRYPDSFEMLRYEAKHGNYEVITTKGKVVENNIFAIIRPDGGDVEFLLKGGSGCTPLRIITENRPNGITLESMISGKWIDLEYMKNQEYYQLEKSGDEFITTLLLKGGAETTEDEKLQREYRMRIV